MNNHIALALVWLLIISVLTVTKVAPHNINADTLLQSIMSLQKLTLYYWGQNRLLNILPLAVSLIKNPTLNLAAVMVLISISFYGLLYLVSRSAAILMAAKNIDAVSLKVFLIISSTFVFVFTQSAVSAIAIWHIEYSFPALLLVFANLKLLTPQNDTGRWSSLIIPVAAITLAIGMNPSTVIPAFFIPIAVAFYKKKVQLNWVVFLLASGVAFFVWDFISKQHGSHTYYGFKLEILYAGIQNVVGNLLNIINLPLAMLLLALLAAGKAICLVYKKNNIAFGDRFVISYINTLVVLFVIGWLLLFAGNEWVWLYSFAWRYFIYIIFASFFLYAVHLSAFLKDLNTKKSIVLTGVAALASILFLAFPLPRLDFNHYKIFERANALTETGSHLYSGDYWVVWPSVLRDMMNGYEAYGLTPKGGANKEAVAGYILQKIKENGSAQVYCLDATIQKCVNYVIKAAGPFYPLSAVLLKDKVYRIDFAEYTSSLDFSSPDFLKLPSQVGNIENSQRVSQSIAGFLVYGPYTPLKSGRYIFNLIGSATRASGAYADLVSNQGTVVHAKFDFAKRTGNYLIRNAEVVLPANVRDVEVRVWVSENDEVKLSGYSLKPN